MKHGEEPTMQEEQNPRTGNTLLHLIGKVFFPPKEFAIALQLSITLQTRKKILIDSEMSGWTWTNGTCLYRTGMILKLKYVSQACIILDAKEFESNNFNEFDTASEYNIILFL